MLRILFFVFLAFLFWLAIRVLAGSRKRDAARDPAPPPVKAVEAITQCAWCGVHVPQGEAVTLPDGRVYCGDTHRDAALKSAAPVDRRPS